MVASRRGWGTGPNGKGRDRSRAIRWYPRFMVFALEARDGEGADDIAAKLPVPDDDVPLGTGIGREAGPGKSTLPARFPERG